MFIVTVTEHCSQLDCTGSVAYRYMFYLFQQDDDERERTKPSHRNKEHSEAKKRETEKRNIDKVPTF